MADTDAEVDTTGQLTQQIVEEDKVEEAETRVEVEEVEDVASVNMETTMGATVGEVANNVLNNAESASSPTMSM
jgi:hypothetical protein